jgi:hypothetical protein
LSAAAAAAIRCLDIRATGDVLVLCNRDQRAIADALALAAERARRSVRIVEYPALSRDGEEPPGFVAEAMAEATVIFAPTGFLAQPYARSP